MTQHVNLPIHGECDQAQRALTDVWAALNRAGCHSPLATAAELIDQLAADRAWSRSALGEAQELIDQFAAQRHRARATLADARDLIATLDDVVEQLDEVRARYAARPGSAAGSAHDVGTLIRYCVYPGCHRSYRADVGPQDRGWMRLRGLTVLCPDHSTAATGGTQDTAPPAESHTQARVGPERDRDTTCPQPRCRRSSTTPRRSGGPPAPPRNAWRSSVTSCSTLRPGRPFGCRSCQPRQSSGPEEFTHE
ncbi:MCP four helix bundle domain-containing protein [Salinispora pacifica]|uniref:hypothetical protein n=1 Tax=Salinispora pacifica TaxID=351187 RepID=UPI000382B422|nr:hypothetical protein [Salinispora pacifica]